MIKHDLVFGIPTQRSKKQEKYPEQAVLTMEAVEGKGTARKIDINTYAVEQLKLTLDGKDTVNFAFIMEEDEKVIYFANTTDIENPANIRVAKQATFSNKKMYDYVAKVLDLDTSKTNELLISNIDAGVGRISILSTPAQLELPIEETIVEENSVESPIVLSSDVDDHSNDVYVGTPPAGTLDY